MTRPTYHHDYQLLIKQLVKPLAQAPTKEIVYRELKRYDYRTLVERIGRLASCCTSGRAWPTALPTCTTRAVPPRRSSTLSATTR